MAGKGDRRRIEICMMSLFVKVVRLCFVTRFLIVYCWKCEMWVLYLRSRQVASQIIRCWLEATVRRRREHFESVMLLDIGDLQYRVNVDEAFTVAGSML